MPVKYTIYGDSGSGKTSFLGTIDKPFIIATDENTLRLELLNKDYRIIKDWSDLTSAREELEHAMRSGSCPYTAACIDTISNTEIMVARNKLSGRSNIALKEWGELIIPTWRDEMLAWCNLASAKKFEHPIDVVFTARVAYHMPEGGTVRYAQIDAPGRALSKEVYAWMDCVLYIFEEEGIGDNNETFHRHRIRTKRYETYLAKDGSGALDPIEEPDFAAISEKIKVKLSNAKSQK